MTITTIHENRLRIGDQVNVTLPDWQRGEHTVQARVLRLVSDLLVEVEIKAGIQTHRTTVARHRVTKVDATSTDEASNDADLPPDFDGEPADNAGLRLAAGDAVTLTLGGNDAGVCFVGGTVMQLSGNGRFVSVRLDGDLKVLASVDDVRFGAGGA